MQFCTQFFNESLCVAFFKISILLLIGLPVIYFFSRMISRYLTTHINAHIGYIAYKLIYYAGISYIILSIVHECGFNITALLGAAGIVGVALGFASQTSMANVVAGIFLLFEQAFAIGDEISSGTVTGKIESIDLFSIKIRTSDNTLVRIPHEQVIKREMTNLSYFDTRRLLCTFLCKYQNNLTDMLTTIRTIVNNQEYVQEIIEMYSDEIVENRCALRIRISINTKDIRMVRERLMREVQAALREHSIIVYESYIGSKTTSTESVTVYKNNVVD